MASTAGPSQEQASLDRNAGSPYDSAAPSADIIIRSSDLINFYVLKAFLSYVSPFFKNMFDVVSTTTSELMNGFPVIAVAETSETIRLLLDFIYPHIGEPRIDNVALFLKVCKATRKYCMDIIENRLRQQIVTSQLTVSEPLRVCAVAIDLNWEDVALIAARNASTISLDKLPHAEELRNISGSGFYRFLDYKFRREKLVILGPFQDYLKPFPIATVVSTPNLRVPSRASRSAQKPFDITAKSDVILRSNDLVDFYVLEDLVLAASHSSSSSITPFLLGIANGETADGRTIINVAEDSEVLHHLLSLIYHISDELVIQSCRLYIQVVLAVRRYGMTTIETRLRKQAAASPLISLVPLQMYIVASALGWAELAKSAAINTLSSPLQYMGYVDELNLITGADLYRLVSFRFRCADATCKVINDNAKYKVSGPGKWALDTRNAKFRHHGPTNELFEKLKSCPRGSTIKNAYDLEDRSLHLNSPQTCVLDGPEFIKIWECRREIGDAVEAAVAKVPFLVCISQRCLTSLTRFRWTWPADHLIYGSTQGAQGDNVYITYCGHQTRFNLPPSFVVCIIVFKPSQSSLNYRHKIANDGLTVF